jgi:hypothetical protein
MQLSSQFQLDDFWAGDIGDDDEDAADGVSSPSFNLLKEDGDAILQENGSFILLEAAP